MRRIRLIILLLLVSQVGFSQFGNEWIDFNKNYFKVKVASDGLYRITRAELEAAGFPVETVSRSRVQLFRKGQEVALNVNTGSLLEWIEFYGEKNDGSSDTELYTSGDQPHTEYNIFSDSSTYFLTYQPGSDPVKRMVFSTDQNSSGLIAQSSHMEDSLIVLTDSYSRGIRFGSGFGFSLSSYEDGEGWTGAFRSKSQFQDFNFQLEDYQSVDGVPNLEMTLIGGNSLTHNILVSVGPNIASLRTLTNINFTGWGAHDFSSPLESTDLGVSGELVVRVTVEGFSDQSDRVSVALVRVGFPQGFDLGAGRNKVYTLTSPTDSKYWLQVPAPDPSGVRMFDITDPLSPIRLATLPFSSRVEVVIPNAVEDQKVLAVTQPRSVGSIAPVSFPEYNLGDKNYLIITHPLLRQNGDPVNAYKSYRESTVGGGHQVQVANIGDLYDLYNYGDPSVLAIKRFISDAYNQGGVDYAFIIGKGFTINFDYYRGDQSAINIPTYGLPGSDLMYTLGIGAPAELPGVAIGRLNAFRTEDVTNYLEKVKEMEVLPYDDLFRKDFLQLSGGITRSEINTFAQIIRGYTTLLTDDFIGGRAFNTGKETSDAVEFIDVADRINQGVGYVTFFGHSSGTVTDIDIGRVSDPAFGYANKGKYPIFLINGCQAGEIFGNNFTFGEDWMVTPDLGAVGFIAHSSIAISSTLNRWSILYYKTAFGSDQYIGESVGDVITEVSRAYYELHGTSDQNVSQVQQMTLQGDPAYRVFGANAPDYHIENTSVTTSAISPGEILATQDSFKVEIVVKNFGRTVQDSLIVQVDRTFANGMQKSYVNQFLRPLGQDTLTFFIPNEPTQTNDGLNILTILLDPENSIAELDETNNQATIEVAIFNGNTSHLYPIDNGTLSGTQVEFQWQSTNQLVDERAYDLEIDTDPDFNSANNQKFTVSDEVLLSQNVDFSPFLFSDTTTIYWRTRYADPLPNETNEWVQTSFTLIADLPTDGWGQYEPEQIEDNTLRGIRYNTLINEWEFLENTNTVEIVTFGPDNASLTYDNYQALISGIDFFTTASTVDPFCEENTLNAIVFDKESGEPYIVIPSNQNDQFNREVCGRRPQQIYQYREVDLIGAERRLQVLVDNMRSGDQIVLFSMGELLYSNWDSEVEATLGQLGIDASSLSLTDGQPVIFLGRKGDAPGTAQMVLDNGTIEPVREQSIQLAAEVNGSFVSGSIGSQRIGPAKSWESFSYQILEELNDNVSIRLEGIDKNGQSNPLLSRARLETIDVTFIDANVYPELVLTFDFDDEADLTPPQLDFWQVGYQLPSEGILLPQSKQLATFSEGEEVTRDFFFYNLSKVDFEDSLTVMATLVNQEQGTVLNSSFKIPPPLAGDSSIFQVEFPSFTMGGLNSMIVEVQPAENELYRVNNKITLTSLIDIQSDETNPLLDVTFDGFRILDGDIVSPDPDIVVRMRDDNAFAIKRDTVGVNLWLRLPGESAQFERINFSDPRLNFTPAATDRDFEIQFQPGPLADGVYALRVQVEDEAGNAAGQEPFEINFEVINEATVTHFYPYPNPFSSSCRFVFTLTGSDIPDEIKIQILTVSGRVVREITQDEIGPIRIGNNITSYAWDGRDEYGDQLANGVYFYKVFLNAGGESLERRQTSADRAFKHGFGKLYILR